VWYFGVVLTVWYFLFFISLFRLMNTSYIKTLFLHYLSYPQDFEIGLGVSCCEKDVC
jgi:hypothetical protein